MFRKYIRKYRGYIGKQRYSSREHPQTSAMKAQCSANIGKLPRKNETCLLILGMSGVNRLIGGYRVISGRERKRTQVLRDFSRGSSAIFVNVPRFIVFLSSFYRQPHTHEISRQTHDSSGVVESIPRGSGVFLYASALFRYVRVYIGSNSAGNRGWVSIYPMVYHLSAHNRA